jgi:hypothetical protein
MRFSDKNVRELVLKKLTGDFDNGLGAVLIGEHGLASFLSEKSREGISGLFQQYRPAADIEFASQHERTCSSRRHNPQPLGASGSGSRCAGLLLDHSIT